MDIHGGQLKSEAVPRSSSFTPTSCARWRECLPGPPHRDPPRQVVGEAASRQRATPILASALWSGRAVSLTLTRVRPTRARTALVCLRTLRHRPGGQVLVDDVSFTIQARRDPVCGRRAGNGQTELTECHHWASSIASSARLVARRYQLSGKFAPRACSSRRRLRAGGPQGGCVLVGTYHESRRTSCWIAPPVEPFVEVSGTLQLDDLATFADRERVERIRCAHARHQHPVGRLSRLEQSAEGRAGPRGSVVTSAAIAAQPTAVGSTSIDRVRAQAPSFETATRAFTRPRPSRPSSTRLCRRSPTHSRHCYRGSRFIASCRETPRSVCVLGAS